MSGRSPGKGAAYYRDDNHLEQWASSMCECNASFAGADFEFSAGMAGKTLLAVPSVLRSCCILETDVKEGHCFSLQHCWFIHFNKHKTEKSAALTWLECACYFSIQVCWWLCWILK